MHLASIELGTSKLKSPWSAMSSLFLLFVRRLATELKFLSTKYEDRKATEKLPRNPITQVK